MSAEDDERPTVPPPRDPHNVETVVGQAPLAVQQAIAAARSAHEHADAKPLPPAARPKPPRPASDPKPPLPAPQPESPLPAHEPMAQALLPTFDDMPLRDHGAVVSAVVECDVDVSSYTPRPTLSRSGALPTSSRPSPALPTPRRTPSLSLPVMVLVAVAVAALMFVLGRSL